MEITITRALNELKLLDSKISKAINGAKFVTYGKNSDTRIAGLALTKDEFTERAIRDLQSIHQLMDNREATKASIVASNATTVVVVGGVEMTVASAIEKKARIAYDKALLAKIKSQLVSAIGSVNTQNDILDVKIQDTRNVLVGKDTKVVTDSVQFTLDAMRAKEEYGLVDPIKAQEVIDSMEAEIDAFESEVDFVLSESNAITKISVSI